VPLFVLLLVYCTTCPLLLCSPPPTPLFSFLTSSSQSVPSSPTDNRFSFFLAPHPFCPPSTFPVMVCGGFQCHLSIRQWPGSRTCMIAIGELPFQPWVEGVLRRFSPSLYPRPACLDPPPDQGPSLIPLPTYFLARHPTVKALQTRSPPPGTVLGCFLPISRLIPCNVGPYCG